MDFLRQLFHVGVASARDQKPSVQELVVYGDEVKKTKTKTRAKKVHFESKALVGSECWYQVKILMKKEEAVRLLSKCKDGGVLDLKDVADHDLLSNIKHK